jgi:penicillin-insensitive murein endopeptidase
MRRWLSGALCAVTLGSSATALGAAPIHVSAALIPDAHVHRGVSIGSPTDGHLVGGSHLTEAPYLRIIPVYAGSDVRWGLDSLVGMIDHSARAVRHQFPDAVLSVGHLSRRGGGDIDRHASHESGRDADLGFYIRGQTGHPLYSDHMVSFRGDGTAPSWPGAFFDDARNWALVASIAQETHARVTYLFVAEPLRARLLAYAAHVGASPAVRNRAAELMVQPRGSLPHDDHFHVRIACPAGMTACVELPTRPKIARSMMAMRHAGHHAGTIASSKGPHPVTPGPVDVPLPPSPHVAPVEEEPVPPTDTTPSAPAVMVAPFDDVDGPGETRGAPRHNEIQ